MRTLYNRITLSFLCSALFAVCAKVHAQSGAPAISLLNNGSMTGITKGVPDDWTELSSAYPVTTGIEGADHFVTLTTTDSNTTTGITQTVPIRTEWKKLLIRGFIRVVLPTNPAPTSTAFIGVQVAWVDHGVTLNSTVDAESWNYTTPGWVEINQLLDVPVGVSSITVTPKITGIAATAYFKTLSLTAFVQTFDEHFVNNTLDPGIWNETSGKHDVSAHELEWFDPSNVSIANHILDIHGETRNDPNFPYQSGQISTVGKFQQLYGLFEFDLKLPVTNGAWPAAYLLRYDDCWPPEIDVEELSGQDTGEVLETNHYADDYGQHRQSNVNFSSYGLDRTQWHHYAVVWEPGAVAWYVDGIYRGTTGEPYDHVSDDPMYITLNLAIGEFGGDPSQSSWPQDFYCRGIKVYQRSDLPLPLYPVPSQEITLPEHFVKLSALSCILPSGAEFSWSLVDGPGRAFISHPNSLSTTATVTRAGMYHFRITAKCGSDTTSADLLCYVNKAIGAG